MPNSVSSRKITINELSKAIGFSTSTVSSVLNNSHTKIGISAKTAELIKNHAQKFGYRPNISARKLRATNSKVRSFDIALITTFEFPTHIALFLERLEHVISREKYKNYAFHIQVLMYHVGRISELPGILEESRFNGAIITNTIAKDDQFFMENEIQYPVVFIGRTIPKYNCVTVNVHETGRKSAEVLLEKCECVNPVIMIPHILTQATQGRLDGFRNECNARNINCNIVTVDGFTEESGYQALLDYINNGGKIDGLYSVFEAYAFGAYYALKKCNLKIPDDVAVVETGESEGRKFIVPSMSSFSKTELELTEIAVEMLVEQLLGNSNQVTTKTITPELILRQSTDRKYNASNKNIKSKEISQLNILKK